MELYFLRHGPAGQHGDPRYKDDSLRPLTDEGQMKVQQASRGMKNLGLVFDVICSSPYLRARQTAEIVAQTYKIKSIHFTDHLLPPAPVHALLKEVHSQFPVCESVLLVGHEPHLTEMISGLLKSPHPLPIDFKKGGLCSLSETGSDQAVLNWLLTPKQLGMMQ